MEHENFGYTKKNISYMMPKDSLKIEKTKKIYQIKIANFKSWRTYDDFLLRILFFGLY